MNRLRHRLMQSDPRIMTCLSVALGLQMGGEDEAGEAPKSAQKKPEPAKPKAKEPEVELSEEEKALKKAKEEAEAEKAKGTVAYTSKDFDTAIAHYTKAHELDGNTTHRRTR